MLYIESKIYAYIISTDLLQLTWLTRALRDGQVTSP